MSIALDPANDLYKLVQSTN